MSASIVGQVSIGQCIPTTASLVAASLVELQGKLVGLLNIQAALSVQLPSLSLQVEGALKAVESLEAMINAGLTVSPPGVSLSVAAVADIIGELSLSIATLAALTVTLGTAGVYVIKQSGDARSFGSDMQAQVSTIAPAGNSVQAITYLATEPAVFAALGTVLLTG